MELREVIEKAKENTGMNQDQLAERIGLDRTALSHALHGRRKIKAEAAIELFDLTGIHPKEILKATVRTTACVALAVVVLYTTVAPKTAIASTACENRTQQIKHYGSLRRMLKRIRMCVTDTINRLQHVGPLVNPAG